MKFFEDSRQQPVICLWRTRFNAGRELPLTLLTFREALSIPQPVVPLSNRANVSRRRTLVS